MLLGHSEHLSDIFGQCYLLLTTTTYIPLVALHPLDIDLYSLLAASLEGKLVVRSSFSLFVDTLLTTEITQAAASSYIIAALYKRAVTTASSEFKSNPDSDIQYSGHCLTKPHLQNTAKNRIIFLSSFDLITSIPFILTLH